MKTTILLLLFAITLCTGCNKDDDTPPITQENTFSCKINGETFVPKDYGGFPNTFDGIMAFIPDDSNDWYFLFGNGDKNIYIYIYNVSGPGIYNISESDGDGFFFGETKNLVEFSAIGNQTPTHRSTNTSGSIEVLELEPNKKIVLKFKEINLVGNDDPNDKVILNDGKLNINLETLNKE